MAMAHHAWWSHLEEDDNVIGSLGNVLVTSISRKVPLVQCVKRAMGALQGTSRLIGGDADGNALARYFTDDFWQMPILSEAGVAYLISECEARGIRAIIPTRDGELSYFAEHKSVFSAAGIEVMVSPPAAVQICLDKLRFATVGSELGFLVIPTSTDLNTELDTRWVVKERFGAGSHGLGIDFTEDAAQSFSASLIEPIFQPYLQGTEYSIDVYVDRAGRAKGAVARTRDLVRDGESQITTTCRHTALEETCKSFAQALGVYGHAVFQAIVDANGQLHLIECNARFGGASTASVAAGLTSFTWFLREAAGEMLDAYPFVRTERELTQVRAPMDVIF